MMNDSQYSKLLKSLADESRLRIIRVLSHEELNVQEICEILNENQPKISRNLAILKNINLIFDRRDGVRIYYSLHLDSPSYKHLSPYIDSLRDTPHKDIQKLKDILKQRTLSSKNFATKIARNWDDIASSLHKPIINTLEVIRLLSQINSITDFGCGTGILLPILAQISKKVYALDHSQQMLNIARNKVNELNITNIDFIHTDFTENNKDIPQSDIYVLHHVLHQIARPNIFLQELSKKMKKNSFVIIIDLIAHKNELIQKQFGSIWAGFSKKQMITWAQSSDIIFYKWYQKNILEDNNTKQFIAILKK